MTVRPGAPYSSPPREARGAATTALWRGRWSPRWHRSIAETFPFRYGQHLVTLAGNARPWGRSTASQGYLTHAVDELVIVWRRGRVICSKVRWRCGASTYTYRLMDEPDSLICPLCTVERHSRERN